MVQPNKVDFDVRKLRKRKKVSRDRITSSEHGECCIRRCRSSSDVCSMRLFAAKTTPLLRTPRIASPTTSRTQASNCQSHLGLLAASQRPHNYHLRLIQHTKLHASCCITSSRLAHRRNRKSGQATRDNANEPDLYLSVVNPFLGRTSKLS